MEDKKVLSNMFETSLEKSNEIQTGFQITFNDIGMYVLSIGAILFLIWMVIFYKDIVSLAFRNVFRNKRRSALTVLAIMFAVSGNLLFGTYFLRVFEGLREFTINSELGHVQIMRTDFFELGAGAPTEYLMPEYKDILEVLASDEVLQSKVDAFSTEVQFFGILSADASSRSITYLGRGIEAEKDRIFSSAEQVVQGRALSTDPEKNGQETLLGSGLAKQLQVNVGDYVTALGSTEGGGINVLDAEVVGIVDTLSKAYSNVLMKTDISFAQNMQGEDSVNKIIVLLHETIDTNVVYERIQHLIYQNGWNVEVFNWYELADFYRKVVVFFRNIFLIIGTILFIVVVFMILNTVTMNVFERVNEFGTLRAIGLKRPMLVGLIISEGVILGIVGGILGIIFGWIVGDPITRLDIILPPPPGQSAGYPLNLIPMLTLDGKLLIVNSICIGLGTAFVASILPGIKAAQMRIVECLRHV